MRGRNPLLQGMIGIGIILTILFAIKGLIVVSQFIGFASFSGSAGTITELIIQHEIPTTSWAGVFGVAVRVPGFTNQQFEALVASDLEEKNLLFDCLEADITNEVYAMTIDPTTTDVSNLFAATAAEIDAAFGKNTTDFDSATNTYTQSVSFDYGTTTINTVGTVTYKLNENPATTFVNAIAKTSNGTPVFVSIITNFTTGFNNRLYNYQVILPAFANSSTTYYFFADPNDVCPTGETGGVSLGTVYGTVTTTSGTPVDAVIVEVAGVTNLTNSSGEYSIRTGQGTHNIYAIKTGYEVYQNNVTIVTGNFTQHDIILEEVVVPNPNTGVGTGVDDPGTDVGPDQDVGPDTGPDEAPLVPIVEQRPRVIEGQDYIISLNEINRKLRLGQFLQERIFVYSFKKVSATVNLEINNTNLSRLITTDTDSITVEPNGKGEFVLTIFGVGETGIFNGTIELTGDLNASIPVNIEVLPREQLPVEALQIDLDTAEKSYLPDDIVRVKTDLRNMLTDQQYPVRLFYTVQTPDGEETVWTYETNVYVKTAFSLIKSFQLPKKVKSGDYILRVTANYLELSSGSSTIFHIDVPFWQRTLFGLRYWLWFLILLLIGAGIGAYFYIRKQIEAKKKYHLKVDYDELPKPGPRSIYVGKIAETDNMTYFKLENFKTHTIVAGSTGGGKSVSAQVIIEEALDRDVAVIVFDPTAQWTGMLRPCKDKTMLSLYQLFGMKKTDAKGFPGNIRQINDAREKIDIKKYAKPGEIQVFAGHKLDPKDMDVLVANAIREIFHANFPEQKLLKIMFVFDEVHRLLPKFGGSGDGFLQIERACREFRKWGLGVMLISQTLSDFVGTIKANINTEIQMRTRDEGDLERIRQKYGEDVLRSLVKATVGSGMVENPAYNRGQPYFVAFKPLKHSVERLPDEEIEQYNTYNDMIDNLFYSLDQLEAEKVDVFDLRLELKLALDKVKTGNFNMVKIYLEGLTPRIDKQWQKLGKQPKQLERELVNMDDIKAELKKAEEERSQYEAASKSPEDGKENEKKEWGWKDDVPPDKILNLKNGMIVINLASLYDEITAMKDKDLPNEFDPEPEEGKQPINNFATWVLEATGDERLAHNLANAKTKDELVQVLEKKKNGEELPEVKPPAWMSFDEWSGDQPPTEEKAEKQPEKPAEGEKEGKPEAAPPTEKEKTTEEAPATEKEEKSAEKSPEPGEAEENVGEAAPEAEKKKEEAGEEASEEKEEEKQTEDAEEKPEEPKPSEESETPTTEDPATPEEPKTETPATSIDDLVIEDEEQAFKLENGTTFKSVKELRDYIPEMPDELFSKHVGEDYNHFADWISSTFHNEELAHKVGAAKSREEIIAALS